MDFAHLAAGFSAALTVIGGAYGIGKLASSAMEASGRALVAADRGSPSGHMYLGEASFERNNLPQALNEFLIARAVYQNRNPDEIEEPVFLNARIRQSMDATKGAKPQGAVQK